MIEAVREWLEKRKSPPTPLFGKEEENMTIDSALLQKTVKDDSQLPLTTNTSEQQSQSSTSDSPLSQRGARGDSSVTLLDIGT
jgi:hypothetical protein